MFTNHCTVPGGQLTIARRLSAGKGAASDQVPEGRLNFMGHTYISAFFHCVFSTDGRRGLIPPAKQPDLWAYLGGIARKNKLKTIALGGKDNQVNLFLSLPATMPLSKAVQLLKTGASKWINNTESA